MVQVDLSGFDPSDLEDVPQPLQKPGIRDPHQRWLAENPWERLFDHDGHRNAMAIWSKRSHQGIEDPCRNHRLGYCEALDEHRLKMHRAIQSCSSNDSQIYNALKSQQLRDPFPSDHPDIPWSARAYYASRWYQHYGMGEPDEEERVELTDYEQKDPSAIIPFDAYQDLQLLNLDKRKAKGKIQVLKSSTDSEIYEKGPSLAEILLNNRPDWDLLEGLQREAEGKLRRRNAVRRERPHKISLQTNVSATSKAEQENKDEAISPTSGGKPSSQPTVRPPLIRRNAIRRAGARRTTTNAVPSVSISGAMSAPADNSLPADFEAQGGLPLPQVPSEKISWENAEDAMAKAGEPSKRFVSNKEVEDEMELVRRLYERYADSHEDEETFDADAYEADIEGFDPWTQNLEGRDPYGDLVDNEDPSAAEAWFPYEASSLYPTQARPPPSGSSESWRGGPLDELAETVAEKLVEKVTAQVVDKVAERVADIIAERIANILRGYENKSSTKSGGTSDQDSDSKPDDKPADQSEPSSAKHSDKCPGGYPADVPRDTNGPQTASMIVNISSDAIDDASSLDETTPSPPHSAGDERPHSVASHDSFHSTRSSSEATAEEEARQEAEDNWRADLIDNYITTPHPPGHFGAMSFAEHLLARLPLTDYDEDTQVRRLLEEDVRAQRR